MIYKKPKGMKYTDMAIYVDSHVYEEDCDDDLIFQYLYHLANMLAHKNKWFNNNEYYEGYAIHTATRVFLRLKSPKQYELKENGEPRLTKLNSCLNYMKMVAYPCKVEYEQQEYSQVLTKNEDDLYNVEYTFASQLSDSIDKMNLVEFKYCLGDIIETAKNYIDKIPYRTDDKIWNNIYLSCLLTFLNSITLKNKDIKRINNLKIKRNAIYSMEDLYAKESYDKVILFHLKDNMHDYIYVLTNCMKKAIAKDLCSILHTYIPSNSGMKNLIFSELTGDSFQQE